MEEAWCEGEHCCITNFTEVVFTGTRSEQDWTSDIILLGGGSVGRGIHWGGILRLHPLAECL